MNGSNTTPIIPFLAGIDNMGKLLDNRTPEQKISMLYMIIELKMQFPYAEIHGQRDFPSVKKDCPSFDVFCGTFNITTKAWVFEIKLDDTVNVITPASEAQEITVYPNPAGDFVEFKVKSEKLKVAELRLYDVFGRQAAGKQITSEQTVLDVSGLPGGVYFYRIYPVSSGVASEAGIYSGKIVIQR
ncbi:MAG: T9SS type A sorting domain-containing protein [Bacteroidales bacterium]|nr:T9SS type A sorting domain-containing protein [Bacteroidales bacterium]